MTTPATYTRNSNIQDLVELLRTNHARKLDVVAPVSAIRAEQGLIVVRDAIVTMDENGVGSESWTGLPTAIMDGGLAERLEITPGYLRRLRARNIDAYDYNINSWLAHPDYADKAFLVRGFTSDSDGPGVGRAFLSQSYKPVEDIDVLMTVLEGIREAGVEVQIRGCSLTDRRMYVRVACEQVAVNALELVKNYRSPFGGQSGADLPMAFAGFEIYNSEVGHGKFGIAPRIELQVCSNGQTRRADAFEAQHLGRKLEVGAIKWSDETQAANLELIKRKTADAVRTFLSPEYVQQFINDMAKDAGVEVTRPTEVVKQVAKDLRYSDTQQDAILAMFIKGGDLTSGGVGHAITAAAQAEQDADRASDMEADAIRAISLAAKAQYALR